MECSTVSHCLGKQCHNADLQGYHHDFRIYMAVEKPKTSSYSFLSQAKFHFGFCVLSYSGLVSSLSLQFLVLLHMQSSPSLLPNEGEKYFMLLITAPPQA